VPEFVTWFVDQTGFAGRGCTYRWSRSDHPWSRLTFRVDDPDSGGTREITRDSETDVLVTLDTSDDRIVALHIENKLGNGHFEPYQPETYAIRAEHWLDSPKFGGYSEYETVLVAPVSFYERNKAQSDIFDCFISHEQVSRFIPEFGIVNKK
jgi:hypothetical protein